MATRTSDISGWDYGLLVVVPGGRTDRHRLDRGTVRVVNAVAPMPLPDQDGDGYDDLLLQRPTDQEGSGIALLRGCRFPTGP